MGTFHSDFIVHLNETHDWAILKEAEIGTTHLDFVVHLNETHNQALAAHLKAQKV